MPLKSLLPFATSGNWWWPEKPDEKFRGTISYDDEKGGTLTLLAEADQSVLFLRRRSSNILLGSGLNSARMTLLYPLVVAPHWSSTGFLEVEIRFSLLVLDVWLEGVDTPCITEISSQFLHAEEWVTKTGYSLKHAKKFSEFTLKYKTVRQRIFTIGDGLKLAIGRRYNVPLAKPRGRLDLEERVGVCIKSKKPNSLSFFLRKLTSMRDFFSLASARLASPNSINLICSFKKAGSIEIRSQERHARLAVREIFTDPNKKTENHFEFLFRESDLGEKLGPVLQKWFEKEGLVEHALTLFNVANHSEGYLETKFIALAQCIETLHRRTRKGTYVSPDEYDLLLPQLTAAIPATLEPSFKAALKSRLKFGNEYSLRKRLMLSFAEHPKVLAKFKINGDRVASEIADMRNYLTHYELPTPSFDLKAVNIGRLCLLLKLLIEATLLTEMGLSHDEVAAILVKNEYYLLHLGS